MYEMVMGWFWWSVVAIVALRFGYTCVLQLPSAWPNEASVLAHQGVQEGSGTCNFFSNGHYGRVMCMWTGLVANAGAHGPASERQIAHHYRAAGPWHVHGRVQHGPCARWEVRKTVTIRPPSRYIAPGDFVQREISPP